jgi:hypothetical protein
MCLIGLSATVISVQRASSARVVFLRIADAGPHTASAAFVALSSNAAAVDVIEYLLLVHEIA